MRGGNFKNGPQSPASTLKPSLASRFRWELWSAIAAGNLPQPMDSRDRKSMNGSNQRVSTGGAHQPARVTGESEKSSVLCESINVAPRRGGAPNDYVYDAACGWFEHHYNASITDANEDGGRPPCESLGIPIDRGQFVPFFCPAYIQMPEKYTVAEDVELQEKTSDHHFSQKKWR